MHWANMIIKTDKKHLHTHSGVTIVFKSNNISGISNTCMYVVTKAK